MEAVERGAGEDGCAVAALLSAGARSESCDLLPLLDSEWDANTKTTLRTDPAHRSSAENAEARSECAGAFDSRGVPGSRRAARARTTSFCSPPADRRGSNARRTPSSWSRSTSRTAASTRSRWFGSTARSSRTGSSIFFPIAYASARASNGIAPPSEWRRSVPCSTTTSSSMKRAAARPIRNKPQQLLAEKALEVRYRALRRSRRARRISGTSRLRFRARECSGSSMCRRLFANCAPASKASPN